MNRLLFILLACLTLPIFAQQDTLHLTLASAQELALENSIALRSQQLQGQISSYQISEARGQLLPQLDARFDIRYFIERPVTFLPGEALGREDDVVPVLLGSDIGYSPMLDLQQVVYDPVFFAELKILEKSAEKNVLLSEAEAANTQSAVVGNYFAVLVNEQRLVQLAEVENQLRSTLENTSAKVDAGLLDAIELERVRLAIDNNQHELAKVEHSIFLGKKLLNHALGMPLDTPVQLTEKLDDIVEPETDFSAMLALPADAADQPSHQLHLLEMDLTKMKIDRQKKATLPTISFYGRLGVAAIDKDYGGMEGREFDWFFNGYIGLRTSWRLNSFYDNKNILPQLELQLRQSELQLQAQQNDFAISIAQAQSRLATALEGYRMQQRQVAFAERELEHVRTRFRNDLASSGDVVEVTEKVSVSQRAVLVAYFEYLSAKFELMGVRGEW